MIKSLFKDSIFYGLTDFFFRGLSLITFPIFARFLTIEQYGIIDSAITFSGLVSIIFVGLHNAIQRYYWEYSNENQDKNSLVSTGIYFLLGLTSLTVTLSLFIFYPLRFQIQQHLHLDWHYIVLALLTIIPSQICLFSQCLLRMHFSPLKFTIISASVNLLNLIFALLFVIKFDYGITGFLASGLISNLIVAPFCLLTIKSELMFTFDVSKLKKLVSFGYPFIFTSLAYWIFGGMDRWMLTSLSSIRETGLYSVGFKFSMVLNLCITAFSQAWSPYAFKMYESTPTYKQTYSRILSLWYFILVVVGSSLFLFAPEFLILLVPSEYWDVFSVIVVLVSGLAFYGTSQVTVMGISLAKKTSVFTKGAWISACVNFLLNLILIPSFGAAGAAFATTIAYCILTIFYFYHSQKLHPIPVKTDQLITISILFLISIVGALLLHNDQIDLRILFVKCIWVVSVLVAGAFMKIYKITAFKNVFSSKAQGLIETI